MDFRKITPYELRLENFEDSDIVSRVDKAKASVLSPKAKDCQRQLNEASSVWAVDGKRFLFIFSEINDEGQQKVSIWAMKTPGNYQRIKTVWVGCRDYIFEAVAVFLIEYFELFVLTKTYSSDVLLLSDIEEKLKEAMRYTPSHLKLHPNMVSIKVSCRNFTDELIDKVLPKGIDMEKYPVLLGLMDSEGKYQLLTVKGKDRSEAQICREIEREFPNWLEAIGNHEVITEIRDMIHYCIELYNELQKSSDPHVRALAKNFYD